MLKSGFCVYFCSSKHKLIINLKFEKMKIDWGLFVVIALGLIAWSIVDKMVLPLLTGGDGGKFDDDDDDE